MRSTTAYRQGDIVLVSFPFTDLTSSKRRPALVLSPDSFNATGRDLVLAAITSHITDDPNAVRLRRGDFAEGGLPKASMVKTTKLFTMHSTLVVKWIGALRTGKMEEVLRNGARVLRLRPWAWPEGPTTLEAREAVTEDTLLKLLPRSVSPVVGRIGGSVFRVWRNPVRAGTVQVAGSLVPSAYFPPGKLRTRSVFAQRPGAPTGTAALECENDARGHFTLWPSGDSQGGGTRMRRARKVLRPCGPPARCRTGHTGRGGSDPVPSGQTFL